VYNKSKAMNENSNQSPTSPAVWRDRSQELREAEWKAHKECLQAAEYALKTMRGQKCSVSDVAKLLDLASKLGRLVTGMSTENVEHAWSQYYDPCFIAQIEAEIDKVFGKPINVESQTSPPLIADKLTNL
jgi:hypothetical protein